MPFFVHRGVMLLLSFDIPTDMFKKAEAYLIEIKYLMFFMSNHIIIKMSFTLSF